MKDFLAKAKLSPLHTHTVYSVLDGASTIDEYIEWCKQAGAPGLGITDHGWAIGALELVTKCNKAGITPLPGVEFYVAPDADYQFNGKPYDYYHVTAWAISEAGYRNLLKLASKSWDQDTLPGGKKSKDGSDGKRVVSLWGGTQQKPRITFEELLTHNEGLVLGSGCLIGVLSKAMLNGEFKGAERNLLKILDVYQGRLFMEIMPHSCSHNYSRDERRFIQNDPLSHAECVDFDPSGKRQVAVNNQIIKMAKKHGLPLLLTVDSHFVRPEQKRLQDVLLSNSDGGWTFHESYHMLDVNQAAENWAKYHGWDVEQKKIFQEAVEGNEILVGAAKGLTVKDPYRQPEPEIPQSIIEVSGGDMRQARRNLILAQIAHHGRMKWDDPTWATRLDKELDVICDNGVVDFSDYFIFLEKVYKWAAQNSLFSAPGRGSGAGSLLCYLLKITHLDPMAWNLPFERFLSQARVNRGKFPDIDCDFGSRDVLISHLREEFGDKMAQCSTLGTLKLKSAIKDACRAILGWNAQNPIVDAVTKTIPNEPQGVSSKDFLLGYKDQDGNIHDGHIHENPLLDGFFKEHPQVYEAVIQLLGIPRSVGRHASAFLISNAPISDSVPTCTISGYLCTQYQAAASNNMVEKAGLIKFDFLRVNTLDDISNTIRMVQKQMGYKVWEEEVVIDGDKYRITRGDLPIDQLPMPDGRILNVYDLPEDPGVFDELSAGQTETVFQMNSALMTGFTKRIRPSKLQHLSDIVAIVRPGPLEASVGEKDDKGNELTMAEAYILRKHGQSPVRYAHQGMEPILKDTFGVALYQEQLQQMFVDLAGYSLEEADYLRETLAKKKRQDMENALPELRRRLKERGWNDHQQEVFVSLCVASSAYSFNRAHSAAYATVAYQCAYLKHHFPVEWWTAVLQNAKVDDIRDKGYAQTLQKQGLLELPSINGPTDTFRPISGKVFSPLYIIDRVGDIACSAIEAARRSGGSFKSIQDFFERVDTKKVNEGIVHNLILCDAFRDIEPSKNEQQLLEEYHYLKKVSSLKIGEGKSGEALKDAVRLYKEKELKTGKRLPVPELFNDLFQIEIAKMKALPIYQLDVHEDFKDFMAMRTHIVYGSPHATYRDGREGVRVYLNVNELRSANPDGEVGVWAGVVQSQDTFQYTDKKTNKKVTALKLHISNAGETVECVAWPSLYSSIGEPPENKIAIAVGKLKESREPGKWEMSISRIEFV